MKRFPAFLALFLWVPILAIVALAGCAGKVDPIRVTADTAATVGERAVRTNAQYVQFCAQKLLEPAKCDEWSKFYQSFKTSYAAFYMTYKNAVAAGDIKTAQDAAARLETLSDQLLLFYLTGAR